MLQEEYYMGGPDNGSPNNNQRSDITDSFEVFDVSEYYKMRGIDPTQDDFGVEIPQGNPYGPEAPSLANPELVKAYYENLALQQQEQLALEQQFVNEQLQEMKYDAFGNDLDLPLSSGLNPYADIATGKSDHLTTTQAQLEQERAAQMGYGYVPQNQYDINTGMPVQQGGYMPGANPALQGGYMQPQFAYIPQENMTVNPFIREAMVEQRFQQPPQQPQQQNPQNLQNPYYMGQQQMMPQQGYNMPPQQNPYYIQDNGMGYVSQGYNMPPQQNPYYMGQQQMMPPQGYTGQSMPNRPYFDSAQYTAQQIPISAYMPNNNQGYVPQPQMNQGYIPQPQVNQEYVPHHQMDQEYIPQPQMNLGYGQKPHPNVRVQSGMYDPTQTWIDPDTGIRMMLTINGPIAAPPPGYDAPIGYSGPQNRRKLVPPTREEKEVVSVRTSDGIEYKNKQPEPEVQNEPQIQIEMNPDYVQSQMNQDQVQQPQMGYGYGQPQMMNQGYIPQPQMGYGYGQPQMNPAYGYGQPQMNPGYPGYGYGQPQQPQPPREVYMQEDYTDSAICEHILNTYEVSKEGIKDSHSDNKLFLPDPALADAYYVVTKLNTASPITNAITTPTSNISSPSDQAYVVPGFNTGPTILLPNNFVDELSDLYLELEKTKEAELAKMRSRNQGIFVNNGYNSAVSTNNYLNYEYNLNYAMNSKYSARLEQIKEECTERRNNLNKKFSKMVHGYLNDGVTEEQIEEIYTPHRYIVPGSSSAYYHGPGKFDNLVDITNDMINYYNQQNEYISESYRNVYGENAGINEWFEGINYISKIEALEDETRRRANTFSKYGDDIYKRYIRRLRDEKEAQAYVNAQMQMQPQPQQPQPQQQLFNGLPIDREAGENIPFGKEFPVLNDCVFVEEDGSLVIDAERGYERRFGVPMSGSKRKDKAQFSVIDKANEEAEKEIEKKQDVFNETMNYDIKQSAVIQNAKEGKYK